MTKYSAERVARAIENIGIYSNSKLKRLVENADTPHVLNEAAQAMLCGDYEKVIAIKNANKNGLLL